MKILKFHTRRGGRFFNPGHVIFCGFEEITENLGDKIWFDEEYNQVLAPEPVEFEFNSDGTGYINIDEEYDTIKCVWENDLDEKQLAAIRRSTDQLTFLYSEELEAIINKYYTS